jgi:hypothetical protein
MKMPEPGWAGIQMNLGQRTAWLFPLTRLQSMRCLFNPPQAQQYNSPVKGMDSL